MNKNNLGYLNLMHQISSNNDKCKNMLKVKEMYDFFKRSNDVVLLQLAKSENSYKNQTKLYDNKVLNNRIKFCFALNDILEIAQNIVAHSKDNDNILMIIKQIFTTLEEYGCTIIKPKRGDIFNPEEHEIINMQEKGQKIIKNIRNGLRLKDKIIKPALIETD